MSETTTKSKKASEQDDARPLDQILGPSAEEERESRMNAGALAQTQNAIKNKVTGGYRHTIERSLLVFREMVAGDEQAELEMSPDIVSGLQKKITEKIIDKVEETLKGALGIGAKLGGILIATYGAVESAVDKQTDKEDKLTAIKAVQAVVSSVLEATDAFVAQAGAAVDSLPDDVIMAAARMLGAVQGAKDDGDADVHAGTIEHGLENWVLEGKLGLPATGGAIIHELAKHYYTEFRAEVRSAKPVHEQVDEIKEIDKLPGQTERKAEKAEETLGKSTVAEVEVDTKERQRVKDL